eukprot:861933-Amphidinium_carterae.1
MVPMKSTRAKESVWRRAASRCKKRTAPSEWPRATRVQDKLPRRDFLAHAVHTGHRVSACRADPWRRSADEWQHLVHQGSDRSKYCAPGTGDAPQQETGSIA